MPNRITNIRLQTPGTGTEKITHVKLASGQSYSVADIVGYLKTGNYAFFYTLENGYRGEVTYVEANPPYIRTKPDRTTVDNLLNLPRF